MEAERAAEELPRVAGKVVLALTADEADALRAVTGRIGGPIAGRRRHILSIAAKLVESGFRDYSTGDLTGDLYFE